jgi:hypothetical protein
MSKNKVVIKELKVAIRFDPSRDQELRLEKVYWIAFYREKNVLKAEIEESQENIFFQNNCKEKL